MNTTQISLVWCCNGFYLRVYCVVWKWFGQQQRTMVLLYSNHPLVGDRPKKKKVVTTRVPCILFIEQKESWLGKHQRGPIFGACSRSDLSRMIRLSYVGSIASIGLASSVTVSEPQLRRVRV